MTLAPRDPFDMATPFRDAMNQLFEGNFSWPRYELFTGRTFPIDIRETDNQQQYVIEASVAGVKPDDLQVTAEGNMLTIRVTQKGEEEKKEKGSYVRRERYEGEMSRTIALPNRIDPDKVQASYEHGVLTLLVPKAQDNRAKQIPVRSKEVAGAH